MARTHVWRRAASVAIAAATAVTLAACGQGGDNNPGPTPTGDSQIGGAPPTSGPPGGTPGPTPGSTQGNNGPVYPSGARSYGQEVLRAWNRKDYNRLGQLGNDALVQQIKDSVNFNGLPNPQWTYIRCGPSEQAPGFTTCVFRNAHGDETAIKVENAKLGKPKAATEAMLERTTYPEQPDSYAQQLLTAHGNGNVQRVRRLSNGTVAGKLTCAFAGTVNFTMPVDDTYSKVSLVGSGSDLGKSYEFTVLKAPGGKANAVKDVVNGC
jgi:hypothetical protein